MSLSAIPRALRVRVFERDGSRCQYCRLAQVGQGAVFHINHIRPRSKGGKTEEHNLTLQCPHCSLHKADKVIVANPQGGEPVALFHPTEDRWETHFVLDPDGRCRGLTPIGRATVDALHMNDPLPRIARLLQLRLGLI